MNRNKLKTYAPRARRDFIAAVTDRAGKLGITAGKGKVHIEPVQVQGDIALISGRAYPHKVAAQRRKLEERIHLNGFEPVIEAMAYTWFNRLMAIRFMEINGYLDHGYRVLSHPGGKGSPEILEQAEHVDLPGLDKGRVIELKLAGDRDEELYRQLLIAQCNALSEAMPFLFERIDDETELLLPDNLLHSDSVIRRLVAAIPEEDWREIEIVGWLYQFYISEKKDQVIGKVVKSEDIPAATQLFTPNWIVKYLLQNSLGRQWLATYPDSALKGQMAYYIEPAQQSEEVKRQLAEITPKTLDSEAITVLDPACGSGHILVEAYELMKVIYQERGYRSRDIPALILIRNLYGLEIDDRAAQLAAFALMMKARADDRRIFERGVRPNVLAIQGCMMGRYRLNRPGLIYAHSGNQDFERIYHHGDTEAQRNDQSKNTSVSPCLCGEYGEYGEFPPDQDGIIPLTETDWFEDDAANRFIEFLKATWGEGVLAENLKFVADSLDPKRGETPQETLRRYLANHFYKDHRQTYKRRPIYWLFSSAATSTANRKKLEKERDALLKQQAELSAFDDKLRHYADQRIGLDLDDGVKVNYGKFGDLPAEVKTVTGKSEQGEG